MIRVVLADKAHPISVAHRALLPVDPLNRPALLFIGARLTATIVIDEPIVGPRAEPVVRWTPSFEMTLEGFTREKVDPITARHGRTGVASVRG
jgi:hypothetical protein